MPPIAHVGHWSLWVLYMVPVVVVLGSIVLNMVRERRAGDGSLDVGDAGGGVDEGEAANGERDTRP